MKRIGMFWLLLGLCLPLAAGENPVLIVYPLDVAPELESLELITEANIIFEQSLLKTGGYQIINRHDFELLLQAQGLMLSGFFDETRVVNIGRMLPAELVARGELRQTGEGFLINLKILDLKSGAVLAAESATGVSATELVATIRQLVFRLSGLKIPDVDTAAPGLYAALTVTSEPKGAFVWIDGREYGQTPLVLDNLPAGNYYVELKKGSLYYAEGIVLEKNAVVYGVLRQRLGNLIIRTEPADARVSVGDTGYGVVSFVNDLPAETQLVTLRLAGFFWQGEVPVLPERTVRIDVALEPTAVVRIQTEPEVLSSFYGQNVFKEFQGSGEITDLPPGSYILESFCPGFEKYKELVEVTSGARLELSPLLTLSAETRALQEQWREELKQIALELSLLTLPELYYTTDVPAMDTLMIKNTFFALFPGINGFIFLDTPLLPDQQLKSLKITRTVQFGTGLLFQAALAGYFLSDDFTLQMASLTAAVIAGGCELGMGIIAGNKWSGWTAKNRNRKEAYAELTRKKAELSELLAEE